jgi:hypothetical protein
MPIAQLQDAIINNNPDLLVNLVAEHRLSPSFLILEKDQNSEKFFRILNSEERRNTLDKKRANELLANFK